MKYIRRPYYVEAVKYDGNNIDELIAVDPIINQSEAGVGFFHPDGYYVPIHAGMWIIKDDGYHRVLPNDEEFFEEYSEK